MRIWKSYAASVAMLAVLCAPGATAQAQLLNSLKGAAGLGQSGNGTAGSGGGLGGMSMPSVGSASNNNIAGLLGFCARNNYLGGSNASSVQQNLLGKLGQGATNSGDYESGNRGLLQTGNGQNFNLGGGGIKAQLTQKICDQVLNHAKSLI